MSNRKFSGNISGKGYYIALVLCAVAIGISGYLYYRNTNQTQPAVEEQPAAVVEEEARQDVAAVATDPVPTQGTEPTTQPTVSQTMTTVSPLSGETVMGYAVDCLCYNQTTRDWRTHDGVDIAAQAGTAVCSAADGEVYSVYEDETMGMTVVILHSGGYTTRYASLAENIAVKAGDQVTAGQTIGYVGCTALLESGVGDHLHFSVSCNEQSVDPAEFLN